ncbi:MAG: PIN/TRAM domain-containing protein [Planctomycetota bacterium]|nr:PIN/TRAM domain-containing protein [Planctomycetota bacterium]MDA1248508.1 PIN/TRAM domain-containing protein [Planctomycetota bacterium]
MLLLNILRATYFVVCFCASAAYANAEFLPRLVAEHRLATFFLMLLVSQVFTVGDILIRKKRIDSISAVYFGLLVGSILAFLFMIAFRPVLMTFTPPDENWDYPVGTITLLAFTYISISLILQTKDDFRFVIPYVEFSREVKGGRPLVVDSSALIDGRISDVVETRIIDAQMLVPSFVLKEVQDIADSSDKGRRIRGRRGLDVLTKMQSLPQADISMYDVDDTDTKGKSVDERLVKLAKELGGRIITNDFNLNKVASVQGVEVINLNDVASALRPRYLPGDHLHLRIQREGESQGQGVGYLDDGTMVVCENGQSLIGKEIEAVVTSVLQSSAGRMIFARPEGVELPAKSR